MLLGIAIGIAGFIAEYRVPASRRRAFTFYGFAAFTSVCVAGLVEALRARIELRDDEIRVVRLVGHKSYRRGHVVDARWEKGCPLSLKLSDGTWAALPETGHATTKVAGAIRAWLNEGT
jgi:hypothetical protein